jgi:hypothetical protein
MNDISASKSDQNNKTVQVELNLDETFIARGDDVVLLVP